MSTVWVIECETLYRTLQSIFRHYAISAASGLMGSRLSSISESQHRSCFSASRDTLTYLSLDYFTTSFGAFATSVDYFPNITALRLRSMNLKPNEGLVLDDHHLGPFGGNLHLRCSKLFSRIPRTIYQVGPGVRGAGNRVSLLLHRDHGCGGCPPNKHEDCQISEADCRTRT